MTLPDLYRAARSLEAIENYARADDQLLREIEISGSRIKDDYFVSKDDQFWELILNGEQRTRASRWGAGFSLFRFAVSEWVARVPGLFWNKGAEKLRELADLAVQYESEEWQVLHPLGKSEKVIGGIGTLKLPPNE